MEFFEIGKKYTFESSHIVATQKRPPFKCRDSIHGHSYELEVSIVAVDINDDGFVLDYGYLDDIMKPEINAIDHSFLYGELDEEYKNYFEEKSLRLYKINGKVPTAENIAKHFAEFLYNNLLNHRLNLIKIKATVKETKKTYASYTINL